MARIAFDMRRTRARSFMRAVKLRKSRVKGESFNTDDLATQLDACTKKPVRVEVRWQGKANACAPAKTWKLCEVRASRSFRARNLCTMRKCLRFHAGKLRGMRTAHGFHFRKRCEMRRSHRFHMWKQRNGRKSQRFWTDEATPCEVPMRALAERHRLGNGSPSVRGGTVADGRSARDSVASIETAGRTQVE